MTRLTDLKIIVEIVVVVVVVIVIVVTCKIDNRSNYCTTFLLLVDRSSLTEDHKRMIRCIRQMQLIIARKRFQVSFIDILSCL
jgi:hypothetical protein